MLMKVNQYQHVILEANFQTKIKLIEKLTLNDEFFVRQHIIISLLNYFTSCNWQLEKPHLNTIMAIVNPEQINNLKLEQLPDCVNIVVKDSETKPQKSQINIEVAHQKQSELIKHLMIALAPGLSNHLRLMTTTQSSNRSGFLPPPLLNKQSDEKKHVTLPGSNCAALIPDCFNLLTIRFI